MMVQLAVNQAILEAEEEEKKNDEIPISSEAAPLRRRNRPKRQVEASSK